MIHVFLLNLYNDYALTDAVTTGAGAEQVLLPTTVQMKQSVFQCKVVSKKGIFYTFIFNVIFLWILMKMAL